MINVYPSQDNPTTQTLWIFSGSSTTSSSRSIRTGSGSNTYSGQDSWQLITPSDGNIFDANKPSDVNFSLSPLFSSTNNPTDIESVRVRTAGVWGAGSPFANNATNTPTITIGSGSRTISHLFLDDDTTGDDMGIRASSSFSYSSGQSSAWTGAGLINKPIGDFFAGTFNNTTLTRALFAAASDGSLQVRVNSQVIPEPQEYALVFGLFALGFVFFHRHRQKKRQQRQAAAAL